MRNTHQQDWPLESSESGYSHMPKLLQHQYALCKSAADPLQCLSNECHALDQVRRTGAGLHASQHACSWHWLYNCNVHQSLLLFTLCQVQSSPSEGRCPSAPASSAASLGMVWATRWALPWCLCDVRWPDVLYSCLAVLGACHLLHERLSVWSNALSIQLGAPHLHISCCMLDCWIQTSAMLIALW